VDKTESSRSVKPPPTVFLPPLLTSAGFIRNATVDRIRIPLERISDLVTAGAIKLEASIWQGLTVLGLPM
jgi:hypothetical protein